MAWVVFVAWLGLGAFMIPKIDDVDTSPVGQDYFTKVVNRTDDTVAVFIMAPRTDSTIRPLGVLFPRDSGWARLPYRLPPMLLLYIQQRGRGGWWQVVPPDSVWQGRIESRGEP